MKTINYRERVVAVQTYIYEYTEEDFIDDCDEFGITGLTFDTLCSAFETNEDIQIYVKDWYRDEATGEYCEGYRMVGAVEFFQEIMGERACEDEPWESEVVELLNMDVEVEDDESYPS